jgi:hypothetical protein
MWIQPISNSSVTSQPQPHSLGFKDSWYFLISTIASCWDIAWALSQVTKGGGKEKFVWGRSQQKAFDDLKKHVLSAPVLSLPDLHHPFEIEIYDSDYVVGIVVTHHGHPVAYHSETLLNIICKYPTYDKDMYSIMKACHQWRHYILGKVTVIHTDHKTL